MIAKLNIKMRVMQMIDPATAMFRCKVCGHRHIGTVAKNGRFKKESWLCEKGCVNPHPLKNLTGRASNITSQTYSFNNGCDPDEIGIDRSNYDPSYDHHYSYSGGCGNPSDGD